MPGIIINIKAGATETESSISANGQLTHVILESDRGSFSIGSDADLKKAVGSYFGKEPTDVYLKSPTPLNDLYTSNGWPEVQTVLVPKKAEILDVNTKPIILKTDTITNTSDNTATFTSKLSKDVTDTISNAWSMSSKVSFHQMIDYKFRFPGNGVGHETAYDLEQEWGRSYTVTKDSTVGAKAGVSVELKPGESATVELSANSGRMHVRITYAAILKGHTAVNYDPAYKGHHFWGLPIGNVLGDINKVQIVQEIKVDFHCNPTVTVKKASTNEDIKFLFADFSDEATPIEA